MKFIILPKSKWTRREFAWMVIMCGLVVIIGMFIAVFSCTSEEYYQLATLTPVPPPTPVPPFSELKAEAEIVSYKDLFRYNELYIGESVYYRGEVDQVIDHGNEIYTIRIHVTRERYGRWTDDVLVYYKRGDGIRLLEDDIIDFVGRVTGLHQYETVLGSQRTIPELLAIRIKLIREGR